ncbi:uncharacterized protein B0H18DRAFT_985164 [Fomitopsis serialis]|uniref:uncharacterized protein n=1 Tax=Fomitopsis serialis TaxID=139415 RepID=UPI002008DBCF|nr:uncharacterized protein B0H18DRAFT_985164 [Neoantrodia serialis]KAH9933019.1 hypothetical protein B0H18DRAFT_985164 [Neoantrodia serialis]
MRPRRSLPNMRMRLRLCVRETLQRCMFGEARYRRRLTVPIVEASAQCPILLCRRCHRRRGSE